MKSYAATTIRPDLTTIVIVGDVTPDQARSVVEKWFGAWKADGPTPDVFPPAVAANRASHVTIPATGRVQSGTVTRCRKTLAITYTHPDYALLQQLANTPSSRAGFYDFDPLPRRARAARLRVPSVDSRVSGGHNRSTFLGETSAPTRKTSRRRGASSSPTSPRWAARCSNPTAFCEPLKALALGAFTGPSSVCTTASPSQLLYL